VDRTFALPLPRTPSLPRWVHRPRRMLPALAALAALLALMLAGGYVYLRETRQSQRIHFARHRSPSAAVLAAAPPTLAGWIARAYEGHEGLTVAMRGGMLIYFGDDTRPHAKWLSAARVLASPSSTGASYIDVRLPERPAAGFPPGTQPPGAAATAAGPGSASGEVTDPTSHSLAESLETAIGSGVAPSTSAPSTSATTATSTTAATASQGAPAEGASGAAPAATSTSETTTPAPAEATTPAPAEATTPTAPAPGG
jgi:hypothetical protein